MTKGDTTPDSRQSSDYQRIACALSFIELNRGKQFGLADLAAATGLSNCHFQRLLRRWAGIGLKRFLQALALDQSQALLEPDNNKLDTTINSGSPGSSCPRDLGVTLHAAISISYCRSGNGLTIHCSYHDSPFGRCLIGAPGHRICWLSFATSDGISEYEELRRTWPEATLVETPGVTKSWDRTIFPGRGRPPEESLSVYVHGSDFQLQVWRALLHIPAGTTVTYGDIAAAVNNPRASRAVGTAIGNNPIAFLIPCHRVICSDGSTGRYRWGDERKRIMLAWEKATVSA